MVVRFFEGWEDVEDFGDERVVFRLCLLGDRVEEGREGLNASQFDLSHSQPSRQGFVQGKTYIDTVVSESLPKDFLHHIFVLAFDYAWGSGEYSECAFSYSRVGRLTRLEQSAQQLRPGFSVVCVLSCNLSNCVAHLVPDVRNLFGGQALQQARSYRDLRIIRQCQEQFLVFIRGRVFPGFGGDSSEDNSGGGAHLGRVNGLVPGRVRPFDLPSRLARSGPARPSP